MTRTAVWQTGPWNQHRNRRILNWAINRGWCRCGHHKQAHQRPHTDCGLCTCHCYRKRP